MLNLTAKIDNYEAKRKFKELEESARNAMRGIENESKGLDRAMSNLSKRIVALGSAAAMTGLVKKIIEVRGEFQQLGIAFETMLGSKEKADQLMSEAVEFAAKTPFTLTDVASNIKQLMAMGVAYEDVMDTMKSLGDVAAGVSVPISRVAINYGQVLTLGKLQSREIRDFAMAGIPLVDELAKNLGVAKSEIQAMVEAGKIGADEVTTAFMTMSSEGGKFYNLMEKQNKSVTGQIANLKDKFEVMFNEIGTSSEGAIYGAIKGAQFLVGHYKDVLDILIPLVATLGAYKVALIACAAAQGVVAGAQSIAAFISLTKYIKSAKDAMLLLNMATGANTIGIVAAAIAALVSIVVVFNRRAKEANEATNRANTAFKEETSKLRSLIDVLNDANMSYGARKDALGKIQKIVPSYHASLDEEGKLISNNTSALDEYLKKREKEILLDTLLADLDEAKKKKEEWADVENPPFTVTLAKIIGSKKGAESYRQASEAAMDATINEIKKKISNLLNEDEGLLGPFLPPNFDKELGKIKNAGDLISDAKKNVTKLSNELKNVKANPQQYESAEKWATAIGDAEKALKDARETLGTLTGVDTEEWEKTQKEYNDWLIKSTGDANEKLIELQLQAEKDRVSSMEEGAAKRKAQFSLEQKESLLAMQKYVRDVVDEQDKLAKNHGKSAGYGTFEVGVDGTLAYNLAKSGLTPTAEQQSVINKMVAQWNQNIVDTWVKETTEIDLKSGYNLADKLLEQLDEDMISGIAKGGFDPLKQQASLIFADISELSSDMIRQIIANAEKYMANNDLTDEAIAEYRRAIDQANEYLVEKNPWEAIKVAQERYVKALKDYDAAKLSGNIEAQNAALLEQTSAVKTAKDAYQEINTTFTETMGSVLDLAEAMGMDSGLTGSLKTLLSAASKVASEFIKVMDTLNGASKAASNAASSIGSGFASGGLIGAFIGLLAAMAQIAVAAKKTIDAANEAKIDDYVENINNKVEALKRNLEAISNLKGPGDSWFTEDLFNRISQANEAFKESYKNITDLINLRSDKWLDVYGDGVLELVNNIRAALASVHDLEVSVGDLGDVTEEVNGYFRDHPGARDWDKVSEAIEGSYENLGVYLAELRNVAAEQEQLGNLQNAAHLNAIADNLQAYLDAFEALQNAVKSVVGDISGSLLNSVRNIWEEFGIQGEESIAKITDATKSSIAEIMEDMVAQQIWATVMADYFDALGDGLVGAIESNDPAAILGVFDTFWGNMQVGLANYTTAMEAFYKSAEAHGWNITPKANDTTSAVGSIKVMREELSKLQEQWDNLSAAEREGDVGKNLFGDIKDLEDKIEAAENLYDVNKDIEGSINDINANLSKLEEEWNAMSQAQREGVEGLKNRSDKSFYEDLLNQAQGIQQSELEKLQALVESSEAKYNLYQKWMEIYGKETAEQMMGSMLEDAEGYLDELRTGIATLSAKVKEGTATDEEIAQLTAWEQTVKDIQDAAAQAAIDAAETAYSAWNEALNKSLENTTTDYEKFAVLSDEMLKAASQLLTVDGTTGEYLNQYITEIGEQLDEVQKSIETNLKETYKTDEQVSAEKLKNFENDLAYAKNILKDADLSAEIERQRDAFISENAQSFIEASSEYKTLFGDLQNLSVQSYEEAMTRVRKSVEDSTELTDEAKAAILASLDEIGKEWTQTLNEKNIEALEKKFDDLTDVLDGTVSLMQSLGASDSMIQMVQGVSEVIKGYKALKVAMEEAAAAGVAMSMSNAFTAIVTMITGLISALKSLGVNMLQIIDNSSVTALANSYDKLTEAISRSVGAQKKAKQQEAVQNLKDQKAELEREYAKEASKWGFSFTLLGKKIQILGPDQGVLDELASQISGIESSILTLGDTMKEDWLQTDTMSFASELSNILTGTYDSYADMMADVEKLTQKTLNNITKQWLQANFLEKSIDEALTALYGGGGTPTSAAYEEFKRKINEASARFKEEMERMNLYFGEEESSTNASTISKSITENTATWIKGLMMNGNILLNDLNNSIDFLNKYSEQTANGVDELITINRQIQANTAVLPEMLKTIAAQAADVAMIKGRIGLSRQYA